MRPYTETKLSTVSALAISEKLCYNQSILKTGECTMDKKIINGYVAEYENGVFTTSKKDIYVIGGKISFSGSSDECEVIDASDRLIMPGLINLHTHAYMSMFRNYADDVSFDEWLFKRIMPVEDVIEREDAYWTNLLGMIEMIETGTTCFSDMHMFEGQSCKAARDAGMRAYIGRGLVGDDINGDGAERLAQMTRERAEYESDTIKFILSPHAIYSCSEKYYAQIAELAAREGLLKQTHLSESVFEVESCYEKNGISPVELLDRAGFLDDKCILAHCVQMRDGDIELLRKRGATVVTNPASNAKLGNGIAPIRGFRESGVNLCIGTDGCASNNTLNMFREMSLLSLMHKGVERDCTFLSANDVLGMATVNARYGGQARNHRRGSVRRPHIPRFDGDLALPEQRPYNVAVLLGERLGGSVGHGERRDADEGQGAPHDRQGARLQRGTQDNGEIPLKGAQN